MTHSQELAQFVEKASYEALSPEAVRDLKIRILDSLGCAVPEVNLFVDHSQIVQLETLHRGIWGTKSTWDRVLTYKGFRNMDKE